MQRSVLLAIAAAFALGLSAQNKTKDGHALSWSNDVHTGNDTITSGLVKVPATTVPVYEARPKELITLLKSALPMAAFKEEANLLTANAVNLPSVDGPVDILAKATEDKKGGFTSVAISFLQNGNPFGTENSVANGLAREIGVKLNKAVVQQQLAPWEDKLAKAGKQHESAAADKAKVQEKADKASADLQKTVSKREDLKKDIANLQNDIARQDAKWQTSQDAKDLKKLTKLREKLAKSEKSLASTLVNESKQQKANEKRQDAIPNAVKDESKRSESLDEVKQTVDALRKKLEDIK